MEKRDESASFQQITAEKIFAKEALFWSLLKHLIGQGWENRRSIAADNFYNFENALGQCGENWRFSKFSINLSIENIC